LNRSKNELDALPEPISLTLEEAMLVTGGAGSGLAVATTLDAAIKGPVLIWGIPAPEWKNLDVSAVQVNAVNVA
jgi:hypothetical protein